MVPSSQPDGFRPRKTRKLVKVSIDAAIKSWSKENAIELSVSSTSKKILITHCTKKIAKNEKFFRELEDYSKPNEDIVRAYQEFFGAIPPNFYTDKKKKPVKKGAKKYRLRPSAVEVILKEEVACGYWPAC